MHSPPFPKKSLFNKNKQSIIVLWEVIIISTTCPGIAHLQRNSRGVSSQPLDHDKMDHVHQYRIWLMYHRHCKLYSAWIRFGRFGNRKLAVKTRPSLGFSGSVDTTLLQYELLRILFRGRAPLLAIISDISSRVEVADRKCHSRQRRFWQNALTTDYRPRSYRISLWDWFAAIC